MDLLSRLGLNSDLFKREFVRKLCCNTAAVIDNLRDALFSEAVKSGLVDEGDKLVIRKKSGVGESVKDKHCGDD